MPRELGIRNPGAQRESINCFRCVAASLRGVIDKARQSVASERPEDVFDADAKEVATLVDTVQKLYENMPPSLRFERVVEPVAPEPEPEATGDTEIEFDREADFCGVTCPLNYVKTKLVLGQMAKGQVLAVLVDSEGSRNVPESVQQDGNEVLSVKQEGEHWRVIIRKLQT